MSGPPANPPYFDGLFQRLANEDPRTAAAFSRHVHWGYWDEPPAAICSPAEYGAAAEALCRAVCDVADIRDGLHIADVGCGFGGTIASLNERFSNLKLVGVNIDARQLQRAAELVQPRTGNSVDWVEADAARIPLPDASFDVVLAVECVFHFNRLRFFAEAARLLSPGGNLTLSDFIPSERAVEYLQGIDLSRNDAVRWSYGQIDLTWSLIRYQQLAHSNQLVLRETKDITANTLPTYDFLYASTADWPDSQNTELFTQATRLLEKACRNGMLSYQILRFERE